jgi:hypothetical protein
MPNRRREFKETRIVSKVSVRVSMKWFDRRRKATIPNGQRRFIRTTLAERGDED